MHFIWKHFPGPPRPVYLCTTGLSYNYHGLNFISVNSKKKKNNKFISEDNMTVDISIHIRKKNKDV